MFTDYALPDGVLRAIAARGITTPTPIQIASLPHTLQGGDLIGQARTGTGKTLAFALPIAARLEGSHTRGRAPRALILTPTRELAMQVTSEFVWAAPHLVITTIYGGTGYGRQASALTRGSDVVVATPGRALDYLKQDILDLSRVEVAVLDEADEMLKIGFEEDVETLLGATPAERQTLLFSATLPAWAKKLSAQHLKTPIHVNMTSEESVSYEEVAIETPLKSRLGVLADVLSCHSGKQAIVFTHTKAEVDELAETLSARGHSAEAIHGDLNQVQRERVVSRFRSGQVATLVGTNVAARGLDIPEVELVVHYRMPDKSDAYQHRSGRTGRAGKSGTVIVLHGPKERREVAMIERNIGRRFRHEAPPGAEQIRSAKLAGLVNSLKTQTEDDKAVWHKVAADWVARGDTASVAGLLAMLLGGAPAPRSLLTHEEGWLTVRLEGAHNVPQVMRLLKEAGAGEIGRIQVAAHEAYADLRPGTLETLEAQAVKTLALASAVHIAEPVVTHKGRSARPNRGRRDLAATR